MTEIVAKEQLVQYITKIEKLEQDKTEINEEIKEVFLEAKSTGFDIQAMKQVIKLRKIDREKLAEQEEILDLYRQVFNI
jgi:uncharacterized protein (UPF0335 family)